MKKTKILSLLLCLSLFCALIVPGTRAYADNEPDSGMKISKTATANADGSYTIMLEAYATGAKVISEITKDVPTDIILVLDQSGSMAEDIGTVTFSQYEDEHDWYYGTTYHTRNQDYYEYRHNGGSANLWHKLPDDSHVSVSVTKTTIYKDLNTKLPNFSYMNECYWDYANNLYEKVGDEYKKVELSENKSGVWYDPTYTYTYTFSDGTSISSTGRDSKPKLGSHAPLYTPAADGDSTVYTYTYTDSAGVVQTIGTSIGAETVFDTTLYERVVNTNAGDSRLKALKDALTTFTETVNEKAAGTDGILGTADDVNHRIAVVGYADTDRDYGYNTGVFIGNTLNRYEDAAAEVYSTALQDMSTTNGKNNVTASLNALQASGATRTDYGLTMANGILNANPVPTDETRNRVVIVFTDGSPTNSNGFQRAVANSAISTANAIKAGGTTVYSIGIFSGADASTAGKEPDEDYYEDSWGFTNYTAAEMSAACNWFMQKVSSNNGTPRTPSYYLSAGDSASLNNIFQQISSNIETGGTSSTLTADAVVKDIISPQFTLPEGATASDITLETYACEGKDGENYTWSKNTDAMGAKASISGDQVNVTGFNFSENYVGTVTEGNNVTYRGHKLVISFTVKPRPGFLGGNAVFTNTKSAGVYENGSATDPVLTFERPDVDVTIKEPTITLPDANVYLGAYFSETVNAEDLKKGTKVKFGNDIELDLTKPNENWGLESWQTEYVTIEVKVTDKDGNEVTNLEKLTEDTKYKVSVSIKPKTPKAGNSGYDESMAGTIHVFKPELTFKDSTAYYGESVPENNNYSGNYVANSEKWKNGGKYSTDDGVQMLGAKPKLDITYTPDESKLKDGKYTKQDVPVSATVKIGTENVNGHTTFVHQDCTGKTCELPEGYHFWIHIQTCTLSITKQDGADNESYVFDVLKDGKKYSEVTVWGNSTETLVELPIGTYTIRENAGWSWRYSANNGSSAELTAQNPTGSITCVNTKNNNQWLNGFSEVVRNIFDTNH